MAKAKKSVASSATSYCVSCKKQTADASEPTMHTTKNGRTFQKTSCGTCQSKKCKFVKA